MTVTASVDLRGKFGDIRLQGPRNTCLAFTLTDLLRFHLSVEVELSPEYLYRAAGLASPRTWKSGDPLQLGYGLKVAAHPGAPTESAYPYMPTDPVPPLPALPTLSPMHYLRLREIPCLVANVIAELAAGKPVGLGVKQTPAFMCLTDTELVSTASAIPNTGHAVLAVGYGTHDTTGEEHLLIRNSWGSGWGDNGYAWVPVTYIRTHGFCAMGV